MCEAKKSHGSVQLADFLEFYTLFKNTQYCGKSTHKFLLNLVFRDARVVILVFFSIIFSYFLFSFSSFFFLLNPITIFCMQVIVLY